MRIVIKYLAISWAAVKGNLAYASEVSSRLFFLVVILYIFMRLWESTYEHSPQSKFAGLNISDVMWYLTITEAVWMSAPRLSHRIDEEVRTGSLCVQLLRPVSYPLYWLCTNLGERVVRFVITLTAGALLSWLLVGPPHNAAVRLGFALLALPLAFILDFLGNFLVGLAAFWLEDTSGLFLVYSRLTFILGGMFMPLQLVSNDIARVLKVLPFAAIVNAPASLFICPNGETLGAALLLQCSWVSVYAIAVALVYRQALSRIAANGG